MRRTSLLIAALAASGLSFAVPHVDLARGERQTRRQRAPVDSTARIAAAQAKRARRQDRNLRIAAAGGIGLAHV